MYIQCPHCNKYMVVSKPRYIESATESMEPVVEPVRDAEDWNNLFWDNLFKGEGDSST